MLLLAREFDCFRDFGQSALCSGSMIQSADGNTGSQGDLCGGQALFSDIQQNLNSGLENGIDARGRTRLNR